MNDTTRKIPEIDPASLRSLYRENETVRAFLDLMADRGGNRPETRVGQALQMLVSQGMEMDRSQVIDMLRELDKVGCGRFRAGRRGFPSRLVWKVGAASVSQLASGEDVELEPVNKRANADEPSGNNLRHRFHLRQDREVLIELPLDLSVNEATRLARFIRALPMEET